MRSRLVAGAMALLALACSTQNKLNTIRENSITPLLSLSQQDDIPELEAVQMRRDTLTVLDENGKQVLIMKASLDENGEMVANDVLEAATVTARFRNIAERFGKVDICFDVTVPKTMQDSRWQLRFYPELEVMDVRTALEPLVITGGEYRKAQLKGYQQYEKFLSSIITDSTRFYFAGQLDVFIRRNMPDLYRFRYDSSYVSDEVFQSFYGITERQVISHYTNRLLMHRNSRKASMKDLRFRRYVKAPIISEGLRLDSVLTGTDEDIVYRYVQTIEARPQMRKADVTMRGEIYEQEKRLFRIPESEPLTFYISSLSSFVDDRERYMTMVTERKAGANATCNINFDRGKTEIDPGFGNNRQEIGRIRQYLSALILNEEFDLDSVVVTSSCSPEGNATLNRSLSMRRSESVSRFMDAYLKSVRDSIRAEEGIRMSLDGSSDDYGDGSQEVRFIPRSNGENWDLLETLVRTDTVLTEGQKAQFARVMETGDVDIREQKMIGESFYRHMSDSLYPKLRTVRFDFHLHRKGMVKDTVHTTILDTTYMRGVQALKDRDYEKAVSILSPYRDYNSAVAYCAMDYNMSALEILQKLEPVDKVKYMMAIIYSRIGDAAAAVQCYLDACNMNRSFVSRGNLDPEISTLIKAYGLNRLDDDEFDYQ